MLVFSIWARKTLRMYNIKGRIDVQLSYLNRYVINPTSLIIVVVNRYFKLITLLYIITGCAVKIPPGAYTTAPPASSGKFAFAGSDLTLTDNGRFQFTSWSDDSPITKGHGGYVIFGKNLFLLFENADIPETGYTVEEVPCKEQDAQYIQFKTQYASGEPVAFVSIYNKDDHSQGGMTVLDGIAEISIPKQMDKRIFISHHIFHEVMEVEFDGDKCVNVAITMEETINRLQLGHAKAIKLKKEGDQLYIKMPTWKVYNEIYLQNY